MLYDFTTEVIASASQSLHVLIFVSIYIALTLQLAPVARGAGTVFVTATALTITLYATRQADVLDVRPVSRGTIVMTTLTSVMSQNHVTTRPSASTQSALSNVSVQ